MRMIPIYNNVGGLLGHIEAKTLIDGHDHITVVQDVSLKLYDPDAVITLDDMTANIYHIPKKQIRFRSGDDDEQVRHYLVIESKLPDWFWDNTGCLEFWPQHFERIPW